MSDIFSQQPEVTQTDSSSPEVSTEVQSADSANQQVADAIAELDNMQKFKFEGQEYTPQELKKAILRQKDYTQKTQSLAEERKTIEAGKSEQKFYENLYADIEAVKAKPELLYEFLKLYPEKFHGYARTALTKGQQAQLDQQQPTQNNRGSQPDFDLMSKLTKFEKYVHEQEVAKNEMQIKQTVADLSKKYPDALPEMAIARVHEAYQSKVPVTPELWEQAFKASDSQMKEKLNTRYSDLVKKQTEANKKGQSADPGGGTIGRAPTKFKSISDVTKNLLSTLDKG